MDGRADRLTIHYGRDLNEAFRNECREPIGDCLSKERRIAFLMKVSLEHLLSGYGTGVCLSGWLNSASARDCRMTKKKK